MVYKDLREFLKSCERAGELAKISVEVDWNLEIGALTRMSFDTEGPGLLFEKIKDYPQGYRLFVGTLGTYRRYAIALGLPQDTPARNIINSYYERVKNPIKPKTVKTGLCKENVHEGDEVDLLEFPSPKWHPMDGGRYLGTFHCCITKDPDSGAVNVGLYRLMIHDKKSTGIQIFPMQDIGHHFAKYTARREPMPMAVAIGQDPVNVIVAASRFPRNVEEFDMAGALRGEPVELVECETVDLEVPATAEIVLEGEVVPGKLKLEGPFGEYAGYYSGREQQRPIFDVKCITHRNNPIHTGTLEGKPLVEDHIMNSISNSALAKKALIDDLGISGIKDVYFHPWSPSNHLAVISTASNPYPGHDKQVAFALWASKLGAENDWIMLVDDDIDPTNLNEVIWALCTRCKPDRDITIIQRGWDCSGINPRGRTLEERRKHIEMSKVIVECRFPAYSEKKDIPIISEFAEYPEEIRNKVKAIWRAYQMKGFNETT
jgi:4-hydroxy-3-polyprenylbenzoate decarboxylase